MTYKEARLKFAIEKLLMLPFVVAGRIFGTLFPLRTRHHIFLFFPNADIGGAPKVNIDIIHCIKDQKPLVIFSKKPKNNEFKELFEAGGARIIDLHRYIDNKWYHFVNFFFRGVIAAWVNKAENPVIVGGESLFFYKMLQHVKKSTRRIEVCHLGTWLQYTIGHVRRIDLRIFSTLKLKEDVVQQYDENKIDGVYYQKLRFIDNAIDIPPYKETVNEKLEVVFIGRGSPQKRVHLVGAIASKLHEAGDPVHFSFVGDVEKMINPADYPFCRFYGNVKDPVLMNTVYQQSDVLILTSAFEGLPVVIMMMMAHAKVVISTAVNGIPDYIFHMENGLLITETTEDKIVAQGIDHIRLLIADDRLRKKLGKRSREIAIEKFSPENFRAEYRRIILKQEQ